MKGIQQWQKLFSAYGIAYEKISSNENAITLTGLAGAPVFRAVDTYKELESLHTKARSKADQMERLLVLGLPLDNVGSVATLPGDLKLPTCRVYGGNAASTFSLSGHRIVNDLLTSLKKETMDVISNGTKVKAPLLNWLIKLAGKQWPYGLPSSLSQLDGLLGLVARDTSLIGHVRARQLSFGRGCSNAVLLPTPNVVLNNNGLNQTVAAADFRFFDLTNELNHKEASRHRIYAQYCNRYLNVLQEIDSGFAESIGAGIALGSSVLGGQKAAAQPKINIPVTAMAGV